MSTSNSVSCLLSLKDMWCSGWQTVCMCSYSFLSVAITCWYNNAEALLETKWHPLSLQLPYRSTLLWSYTWWSVSKFPASIILLILILERLLLWKKPNKPELTQPGPLITLPELSLNQPIFSCSWINWVLDYGVTKISSFYLSWTKLVIYNYCQYNIFKVSSSNDPNQYKSW